MIARIQVKDREEARLLETGLQRPDVRAFVKIVGALIPLPSDRARARVLRYALDRVEEEQIEQAAATFGAGAPPLRRAGIDIPAAEKEEE